MVSIVRKTASANDTGDILIRDTDGGSVMVWIEGCHEHILREDGTLGAEI